MLKLPEIRLPAIPSDKAQHFLVGQGIALVMLRLPVWASGVVILVLAIWKELQDGYDNAHTRDAWDAIATMAGGLAIILARIYG